jgi:hypothetical protein
MCWISHDALTIVGVQGFRGRTSTQRLAATVLATLVSGCVAVAVGGAARSAPPADDDAGGARSGTAFRLGANEASRTVLHFRGAVTGRTVRDSSGARNPGRLLSGRDGGVLSARSGDRGRYLRFAGGTCSGRTGCPWAVVVVRPGGDPEGGTPRGGEDGARQGAATAAGSGPGRRNAAAGEQDFTFGAWVRLTSAPGRTGMTVIRRGFPDAGEAHWSLEVDDGRVSCRWSDGESTAVLPDDIGRSVALGLGRWYALACSRHGSRFGLTVTDPVSAWPIATYSELAPGVGHDRPRGPITIGAGADGPPRGDGRGITAPFHGDLDEVMVRSG